jgi:uncharacterized protein YgiM (DUF1202 family)
MPQFAVTNGLTISRTAANFNTVNRFGGSVTKNTETLFRSKEMRPVINLLVVVCFALLVRNGFTQQPGTLPQAGAGTDANEAAAPAFPYIAEITGNDVYIRSGPGTNHYPCGTLNKGDRVTVVGSHFGGWSRIVPPPGSFSWISAEYVEPESADSTVGVVSGNAVFVYVGSPGTDLIHSTTVDLQLNRGEKVKLLGEKQDNYYKIAPPSGAYRWVSTRYTRPIGAVIEPPPATVTPPEEPAETPSETPSVVPSPAPASADKLEQYHALESQLKAERAKPMAQQNYDEIKKGLLAIANDQKAGKAARYAQLSLKQIKGCELALQVAKTVELQDAQLQKVRSDIARAREKRMAELKELGGYTVIGWFHPFTAYGQGQYRIVDESGKTLCCAVPTSQMNVQQYVGEKVGLMGVIEPHLPTAGAMVRFAQIAQLD